MSNSCAVDRPSTWPDLVSIIDPTWLAATDVGNFRESYSLLSSHASRRTLRHILGERFQPGEVTQAGAAVLQWLSEPRRSYRLALRLGAVAAAEELRYCINGPRVRDLREALGQGFLARLLADRRTKSREPLVLPVPSLPAEPEQKPVHPALLGLGKALLHKSVPDADGPARRWIDLSLPKGIPSLDLGDAQVAREAIRLDLQQLATHE